MKTSLIFIAAIAVMILVYYVASSAGIETKEAIRNISDPTERGCAYIAVSIFVHALLSSMGGKKE